MHTNPTTNDIAKVQPKTEKQLKKRSYKPKNKKAKNPNDGQADNLVSAQLERRRSGKVKDLLDEDNSNLVSDALKRKRDELNNITTGSSNCIILPIAGDNVFYFEDVRGNPRCIPIDEFIDPAVFSLDEAFLSSSNRKIYRVPETHQLEIRSDGWWRIGLDKDVEPAKPEQEQHLGLLACIFIALIAIFTTYIYYYEPKETNNDDIQTLMRTTRHMHWPKH